MHAHAFTSQSHTGRAPETAASTHGQAPKNFQSKPCLKESGPMGYPQKLWCANSDVNKRKDVRTQIIKTARHSDTNEHREPAR